MDLRPWGYWMRDGYPYEGTAEIVALTEEVLRRNPKHPGALHMYIHLMEPTSTPERAEKAADTLLTLMPAAGHMIHMSSHIYQRVGRYADSMKSNQLAIAADEDYITQCRAQGIYPMMYYPHNIHFLWFAATGDGQSKVAIKSAREAASKVDDAVLEAMPLTAIFRMVPYWALARFGYWKEILEEPAPPPTSPLSERELALCARPRVCCDATAATSRSGTGRVARDHEEPVAGSSRFSRKIPRAPC